MIYELQKLVDALLKLASNLPSFGSAYYVRIGLSLVLVGLSTTTLIKSRRQGYRAMNAAIERLKGYVRSRSNQAELLTATSLRALAASISTQMQCPPLTDGAVAEAIRSVALEFEDVYSGAALKRRLQALNQPLKELDPNGNSLLCLAIVDRMVAYFLIAQLKLKELARNQIVTEAAVFAISMLVWWISRGLFAYASYLLLLLWVYPARYAYFAFIAFRADRFWRRAITQETAQTGSATRGSPPLFGSQLDSKLDRFAYPIQSTDTKYLTLTWAPVEEAPFFRSRSLALWFAGVHQYKYFEVRNLERKLLRYQKYLPKLDGELIRKSSGAQACAAICRRLWILTGHSAYLAAARADAQSSAKPRASVLDTGGDPSVQT